MTMQHSKVDYLILHLSLIDGVGAVTVDHIVQACERGATSWDDLVTLSATKLSHVCSVSSAIAHKIHNGLQDRKLLERECALIEQHQISWVSRLHSQYPKSLSILTSPPPIIMWRGILHTDQPALAIVGSRNADVYAERAVNVLVPPLIEQGWSIVSGGARGADSMAHQAALDAQGHTVVVLGSGLLRPYPRQNEKLFDQVVAHGGAVLSIFSLETAALAGNFPARNHIIAALSQGCLVVQAAEKSGAMITAYSVLDQGKQVFALPGRIDNPLSIGCHRLIQQGAKLVTNVSDITEEFSLLTGTTSIVVNQVQHTIASRILEQSVPDHVTRIVHLCDQPRLFDELLIQTKEDPVQLQSLLFDLMLQGIVEQNAAGLWHVCHSR